MLNKEQNLQEELRKAESTNKAPDADYNIDAPVDEIICSAEFTSGCLTDSGQLVE